MKKLLAFLFSFCLSASVFAQNIHTFGDSITFGYGASVPANDYVSLVSAHFGYPLVQHAVSGSMALDQSAVIDNYMLTNTPNPNDIYTIMIGINDAQHYTTPLQQAAYFNAVTEIVAKATYPQRVNCQDAGMVKVGPNWVNQQQTYDKGCYDNNAGDTATTTVSGETIIVGSVIQDYLGTLTTWGSHVPGNANVYVDGVMVGSFSSDGYSDDTGMSSQGPVAFRYTGFTNTTHTVQVEVTSGFIYLDYILGSNQPQGPKVFLLTPTRTFQSTDNGSVEIVFSNFEQTIANQFTADGRLVYLINTNPVITSSLVISDLIHPNDAGYAALAATIEAGIEPTIGPPPTIIPAYLCTNGTGYFGAQDLGCTINLQPL